MKKRVSGFKGFLVSGWRWVWHLSEGSYCIGDNKKQSREQRQPETL
jgi:hypothetical protein